MFLILAVLSLASAAVAAESRIYFANQTDWYANKGFYVGLENSGEAVPMPLKTAKLVLAVGDGAAWRFVSKAAEWRTGYEYSVKAVYEKDRAELYLDGASVGSTLGALAPVAAKVDTWLIPGWASTPTEYTVRVSSVTLTTNTGRTVSGQWKSKTLPAPGLQAFEPQYPKRLECGMTTGEILTVTCRFRLELRPDVRTLAPFIDRYGQAVHARFTGKVKTDSDLRAAVREEERRTAKWVPAADRDEYGGQTDAGWSVTPTGYYGVAKRDGFWWMTSPKGNPLFYLSTCTVDREAFERTPVTGREFLFAELPPKEAEYARAWRENPWGGDDGVDYVSFYTANLARKYGPDWYGKTPEIIGKRLRDWGFTGMAKWSDTSLPNTPNIAVAYWPGVPDVAGHPDVFDPAVREIFRESLRKQIEPRKTDSWLLGWSVGNEYAEIIQKNEIRAILTKPASTPVKRAVIDHVIKTGYRDSVANAAAAWKVDAADRETLYSTVPQPSETDLETMRRFYADRYYAFIHETVKSLDPNHLYFGFWIVTSWWENESDWDLLAAHCDVVGYDRYHEAYSDPDMDRRLARANKPVFCGEFSFPPYYDGKRGFGVYAAVSTRNDKDAGRLYERWVKDAARNPWCVGLGYFRYRDQPLTGRGPRAGKNLVSDEHYAFGLVDITDRPKWDFIDKVRAANLAAAAIRTTTAEQTKEQSPKTE